MAHSSGHNSIFINSQDTPLYSVNWVPTSAGGYAGTCIFLIVLALLLRCLVAFKTVLEQRWLAQARCRRYVVVKGMGTEAGKIESDPAAKAGALITTNGVEENVKIVQSDIKGAVPFRLSIDIPRAGLVTVTTGVAYLLMLAVMTMNVGYFLSVLAGTFVGELAVGRHAQWEDH